MSQRLHMVPWRAVWLSLAGCVGIWHAASGPQLYDSGELAAAAWHLGASHPPGQPLHALIAHVAIALPLGPIPWRMASLSTGTELLAAWWVIRIVQALQQSTRHDAAQPFDQNATLTGWVQYAAPDAAAMGFLLSSVVLRQALRIEVYGLALALSLYGTYHAIRWMQHARLTHLGQATFAATLCMSVHAPHALAPLGMILCSLFVVPWRRWLSGPFILAGSMATFCGLAFLSWLPLRAYAGAPMWGKPSTGQGFWDYLSARAYQHNLGATEHSWLHQSLDALGFAIAACGILPIVGMGLALLQIAHLPSYQRKLHIAVILGALFALAAGCLQPLQVRNPDNIAYFGPVVALMLATGAAGFSWWSTSHHNGILSACGLLLIALNIPTLSSIPSILEAEIPALETFSEVLTEAPPPKSLVIVETDFTAAAWMMAQAIDGARPDIALFISGLATSSWHWQTLRAHPYFDGRPRRGRGQTAMQAYNDGLVRHTFGHLPIVSEAHWPTQGQGLILGPYVYLPTGHNVLETQLNASMAERWTTALGQDIMTSPIGDYGAAMAVLRHHEISRAKRLVVRQRIDEALEALRYALRGLPSSELRLLSGTTVKQAHIPPPVVRDPDAFLVSKEDAVREAACLLWAIGASDHARQLLNYQLKRGDVRSVLQLAWIELAEGNLEAAKRTHDAFVTVAPQLASEALPLEHHLK